MLADAVNANQPELFEGGFQLFLAGLVFWVIELATERVPGCDVGSAQSVVLVHEGFEWRAGLADVQGERGFVVYGVVGFCKGLQQLGGQGGHGLVFVFLVKRVHHGLDVFGQVGPSLRRDVVRNAVERFSDAARYRGDGVAVAAQRYGVAYGIFKAGRVQRAADGLWHRVDGFFCTLVSGANVVGCQVKGIAITLRQSQADVLSTCFLPCPKDGQGYRLRGVHAVGVVVRDGGHGVRPAHHLGFGAGEQSHGGDAHGCAIAPAAVRLRVIVHEPFGKLFTPPAVFCIAAAPLNQGGLWVSATRQGISHRHGAHRVIGKSSLGVEQRREVFTFEVAELVGRANDVANEGAEHGGTFRRTEKGRVGPLRRSALAINFGDCFPVSSRQLHSNQLLQILQACSIQTGKEADMLFVRIA